MTESFLIINVLNLDGQRVFLGDLGTACEDVVLDLGSQVQHFHCSARQLLREVCPILQFSFATIVKWSLSEFYFPPMTPYRKRVGRVSNGDRMTPGQCNCHNFLTVAKGPNFD